jgi:hypothetical protein
VNNPKSGIHRGHTAVKIHHEQRSPCQCALPLANLAGTYLESAHSKITSLHHSEIGPIVKDSAGQAVCLLSKDALQ